MMNFYSFLDTEATKIIIIAIVYQRNFLFFKNFTMTTMLYMVSGCIKEKKNFQKKTTRYKKVLYLLSYNKYIYI